MKWFLCCTLPLLAFGCSTTEMCERRRESFINSVGMRMTRIDSGSYLRGSPPGEHPGWKNANEDLRNVIIAEDFYIGCFEVTQCQYEAVTGTNPSYTRGPDYPVEMVTWRMAESFCEELTLLERNSGVLPDGWHYRLPYESEWEYACRAGTTTAFNFGDAPSEQRANFGSNERVVGTKAVGSYPPNNWGLFDMHGNVAEWCEDYDLSHPNDRIPIEDHYRDCEYRAIRGGSWCEVPVLGRSAARGLDLINGEDDSWNVGFRVVLARNRAAAE